MVLDTAFAMASSIHSISVRLLAFNILLVFLPAAGILYVGTYEQQLLQTQERSMVQQARILAAALSNGEKPIGEAAGWVLKNLQQRTDARIRVIDFEGRLLADSSRLGPRREPGSTPLELKPTLRGSWLYRGGALIGKLIPGRWLRPGSPVDQLDFYSSSEVFLGNEVKAALNGRYGAATRISAGGQRSVTLYSAIPIRRAGAVVGAVLVSQSTFGILEAIYEVRLGVFKVFLASILVAVILSLTLSRTIARPLQRLSRRAQQIVDRSGRLKGHFHGSHRQDEIGELARGLEQLTHRLERYIHFMESFAADISHELKNPLASIRSASEILFELESPQERAPFVRIIESEVARLERLLSELREITKLDASLQIPAEERVDLGELLANVVAGFTLRLDDSVTLNLKRCSESVCVQASIDRLTQVLENLLSNAVSFSPPQGSIDIELKVDGEEHVLKISDRGPGIDPQNLEKVFSRFFTYRPELSESNNDHTGLGLAIVKTIVEGYGGSVRASNRPGGGTCMELRLPADSTRKSPY